MKLTLSLYEISPGLYYSFYKDFPTKSDIIDELVDIKNKLGNVKTWYFESVNSNGNHKNKIFIFGGENNTVKIQEQLNSIKNIPKTRILVVCKGDEISISENIPTREDVDNEFKEMLNTTERRNVTLVQ